MTKKWIDIHSHDLGRILFSSFFCWLFYQTLHSPADAWIPFTFSNLLVEVADVWRESRITWDNIFDLVAGSWGIPMYLLLVVGGFTTGVIILYLVFFISTLLLWKWRAPRILPGGEVNEDSPLIVSFKR